MSARSLADLSGEGLGGAPAQGERATRFATSLALRERIGARL